MAATILTDTLAVESQPPVEVESAKCDCCGLTEECTPAYIEKVKERYNGRWICGLCGEAVKDEILRRTDEERLVVITTEEALTSHNNFCKKFAANSPSEADDPALHLISAMRQILRRSLDSPRRGMIRSTPGSPTTKSVGKLARTGSCFSALSR
ncbi:hypothetical protein LINGRAHAP2_LOCUS12181 [Linum grandiflorum]